MGYHWFIIFVYLKTFLKKKQQTNVLRTSLLGWPVSLSSSSPASAPSLQPGRLGRLKALGCWQWFLSWLCFMYLYVYLVSRAVSLMFTQLEWYIHQKPDSDCIVKNLRKLFSGIKLIKRLTLMRLNANKYNYGRLELDGCQTTTDQNPVRVEVWVCWPIPSQPGRIVGSSLNMTVSYNS